MCLDCLDRFGLLSARSGHHEALEGIIQRGSDPIPMANDRPELQMVEVTWHPEEGIILLERFDFYSRLLFIRDGPNRKSLPQPIDLLPGKSIAPETECSAHNQSRGGAAIRYSWRHSHWHC